MIRPAAPAASRRRADSEDLSGVLIYEVNLAVDRPISGAFTSWLAVHIRQMLALPGFEGARVYRRRPEDEGLVDDGRLHLTVHYTLADRAALETYLTEHAGRMRGESQRRFGGRFAASRRVLEATSIG